MLLDVTNRPGRMVVSVLLAKFFSRDMSVLKDMIDYGFRALRCNGVEFPQEVLGQIGIRCFLHHKLPHLPER